MTEIALEIIPISLLTEYLSKVSKGLQQAFDALQDAEISPVHSAFIHR
jgi:hypothetical protein